MLENYMPQYLDIVTLQWLGILFCVSQSAMFSGLNLAFFSLSCLQLEVEVSQGNKAAVKILKMRQDSNFLLTIIITGADILGRLFGILHMNTKIVYTLMPHLTQKHTRSPYEACVIRDVQSVDSRITLRLHTGYIC